MRTTEDMYTQHRHLRVYRRDLLIRPPERALHDTGMWYTEPIDWNSPFPAQRGYGSLWEALTEAQLIEDVARETALRPAFPGRQEPHSKEGSPD